jgi:hypothetical protein
VPPGLLGRGVYEMWLSPFNAICLLLYIIFMMVLQDKSSESHKNRHPKSFRFVLCRPMSRRGFARTSSEQMWALQSFGFIAADAANAGSGVDGLIETQCNLS